MSGNSGNISLSLKSDETVRGILRYALGSALIMMFALGLDYQLAYFTPVLALNFLVPGTKAPSLKSALVFLFSVATASFSGYVFSRLFLDYPLVFLPLLTLILFHLYYTTELQFIKVWLIISLLLIPMMSMQSVDLGRVVAVNLFINALVAVSMVSVIYLMIPSGASLLPGKPKNSGDQIPDNIKFISATTKTLVVLPVLILFFVFHLSDAMLILFFVAILSMNPATANKKTGLAMILANLGGGLAAILVFNLLTVATSYIYSGILTLLVGLIFAQGLFKNKPTAQLFGMAFSTFLLILGNVISIAGEAGDIVWTRIFQIGVAMVYMVVAFAWINSITASFNQIKTKG